MTLRSSKCCGNSEAKISQKLAASPAEHPEPESAKAARDYCPKERAVPFLVLVLCGLALGVFLGVYTRNLSLDARDEKFRMQSVSIASLVTSQWDGYTLSTKALGESVAQLQSVSALTRERFSSMASLLHKTYPAKAYEFAPTVLHADRAAEEAESSIYWRDKLNLTSNATFPFKGLQYDGDVQLPDTIVREEAASYLPVSYIEPVRGNEKAINLDLLSRRGTSELLQAARVRQDAVASFRIELVQDMMDYSFGVIIFFPVPNSDDFVLSVVRVQELLRFAAKSAEPNSDLYLYDASETGSFVFLGGVSKATNGEIRTLPTADISQALQGQHAKFHIVVTSRDYLLVTRTSGLDAYSDGLTSTLLAILVVSFVVMAGGLYLVISGNRAARMRAKLSAEIREAQWKERIRVERGINEFLSHEVRNPLSVAIAAVDLSASEKHVAPSDLKLIKCSLQYINELLNNMLDVQKLDHDGEIELHPSLCSLRTDVLEAVQSMLAHKSGVQVTYVCDDPLWVTADVLRLKQIVLNLAKNSVKFVKTGYIRITGKRDPNRKGIVVIAIEDSGPGVPENQRAKLFSKFETLSQVSDQGTGLGLFLCKSLVQAMKGSIYLDANYVSELANCSGCRFVVELPLADMESAAAKAVETPKQPTAKLTSWTESQALISQHSLVLLLVDDDPLIRLVTTRILKQIAPHWTFLEATNGREALEKLKSQSVDVIIVDHYMPGTPGWTGEETIKKMRQAGIKALIIGCSANEKKAEHIEAGADAFLRKPIKAECLRRTLAALLSSKAFRRCPSVCLEREENIVVMP